jgi:hypothetical protein
MPTVRAHGALLLIAVLGTACAASGASPSASSSAHSAAASASASLAAVSASTSSVSAAPTGIGLPDGIYTAGRISGQLSGLVRDTIDLPLQTAGSRTVQGSTLLTYQSEDGIQVVTITLAADGSSTVTFIRSDLTAAGISGEGCSITISQAGSSGLTGSIDCHALTAINASASAAGTIDMLASFEATR